MSERYLCVNCWQTPLREETFFRCPECEGSGDDGQPEWLQQPATGALRPLADVRPPWYRRWFSAGGNALTCPDHKQAQLLLYCWDCKKRLADNAGFHSRRPLGLGFAGPRSSGKTLLTIVMVEELRGLEVAGRRVELEGLGDTEERFHRLAGRFLRQGYRPDVTDPDEAYSAVTDGSRNFCWKLLIDGPDRKPTEEGFLAVYDVAGEIWGAPREERFARFDRYINLLGSLVFLIDGAEVAADLDMKDRDAWDSAPLQAGEAIWSDRQWLTRVVERLGGRARQVDLALVLSKADYFWEHAAWADLKSRSPAAVHTALKALLQETRRLDLWAVARKHFRRVELFAVSSLGFHPGPDDVDDAGRLRPKIEPAGAANPLKWLLQQRLGGLR